ncbi:type IV secretion system DNA-binding domain-containing protein [Candidatus Saccharibacteria bacterium]|nr:type IV secretion system DNA-binding domain-containing protein [Candidatus Saccharibacteria bacterium]
MKLINITSWTKYEMSRPFTVEQVSEMLSQLCTFSPRGFLVFEIRASYGRIEYLLGMDSRYTKSIKNIIRSHIATEFSDVACGKDLEEARPPVTMTKFLTVSKPILSLNTDFTMAVIRQGLAVMASLDNDNMAVLQVILGKGHSPSSIASKPQDPHESWLDLVLYGAREASNDAKKLMKEKAEQYNFQSVIRVGVSGNGSTRVMREFASALKTIESAGVHIRLKDETPDKLNEIYLPWQMNLRLSIKELIPFLMLPVGEDDLSGISGMHPKRILLPKWYQEPKEDSKSARVLALSNGMNSLDRRKISISPKDALEHTIILGPTGSGKSTVMEHLIISDIKAGRSVLVLDPKADLVTSILERIPVSRRADTVVIDPSDASPVGFNPLHFKGYQNHELVSDAIISILHDIFSDSWGIRTQQILSAALLTLTSLPDTNLLHLSPLLTNPEYRARLVARTKDRIWLLPFWRQFEAMKESERATHIAPVLNKLEQFIFRPSLRNILGQSRPKFNFMDLFFSRKIVLVPLNKGLIGSEAAKLLGSLIVGLTWTVALSRAGIPKEKRHMVSIFIDELQDYLKLPTDLSDALSQARGLGLAITMAHQYRAQLTPELREAIDANARNKIIFGLNGGDAKDMAGLATNLDAEDFMLLPRYEIYANIMAGGRATGWISGTTLPPEDPINLAAELKAESSRRYGKDGLETETEFLRTVYPEEYRNENGNSGNSHQEDDTSLGRIGRSRR